MQKFIPSYIAAIVYELDIHHIILILPTVPWEKHYFVTDEEMGSGKVKWTWSRSYNKAVVERDSDFLDLYQ